MDFFYNNEMLRSILKLRFNNDLVHVSMNYGNWKHRKSGSSMEFQDFRNYEKGDELKKIDWKYFGRSRELIVKTFNDERKKIINIFLDNSKSMDFGRRNKFQTALEITFYLINIIVRGFDDVRLYYLDNGGMSYFEFSKTSHPDEIYSFLSRVILSEDEDYFLKAVEENVARGHNIVVSDFYSDTIDDFLEKNSCGVECGTLINILTEEELHPEYRDLCKFVDLENKEIMELNVDTSLLRGYRDILYSHMDSLEESGLKWGFKYNLINTDMDMEKIFFKKLVNLGILR